MERAVLMYHDVVAAGRPDESGFRGAGPASYKIDWPTFDAHLDALRDAGVPLDTPGGDSPTDVLLTFDDAGSCSLAVGRELHARGLRGHFFASSSLVGADGFASEDDLRALRSLGHVVGTHSRSHPSALSTLSAETIADEWRLGAGELATLLGEPVTTGSVPGGFTSRDVEMAAAAAGITLLFTSEPTTRARSNGACVVVGRYAVRTSTTADEVVQLALGRGSARRRQATGWALRAAPKRLLGPAYPRARATAYRLLRR